MAKNSKLDRYNILETENIEPERPLTFPVRYRSIPLSKHIYTEEDIYTKKEREFRNVLTKANENLIYAETNNVKPLFIDPITKAKEENRIIEPKIKPAKKQTVKTSIIEAPIEEQLITGTSKEEAVKIPSKNIIQDKQKVKVVEEMPQVLKTEKIIEKKTEPFIPQESKKTKTKEKRLKPKDEETLRRFQRIESLINKDGYYNDRKPSDFGMEMFVPQSKKPLYIKAGIVITAMLAIVGGMTYYFLYFM